MAVRKEEEFVATPYQETFRIKGTRGFLFNRPPDDLDYKVPKLPKLADHEKKVWRVDGGLAYPGSRLVRRLGEAGKGTKNPFPRGQGSANKPILQSITVVGDELVPFLQSGTEFDLIEDWDVVKRDWVGAKTGGYTHRPYLDAGWEMEFTLACAYPEYFPANELVRLVNVMGLIGIGDFVIGGYGRFAVIRADPPEDVENWI